MGPLGSRSGCECSTALEQGKAGVIATRPTPGSRRPLPSPSLPPPRPIPMPFRSARNAPSHMPQHFTHKYPPPPPFFAPSPIPIAVPQVARHQESIFTPYSPQVPYALDELLDTKLTVAYLVRDLEQWSNHALMPWALSHHDRNLMQVPPPSPRPPPCPEGQAPVGLKTRTVCHVPRGGRRIQPFGDASRLRVPMRQNRRKIIPTNQIWC